MDAPTPFLGGIANVNAAWIAQQATVPRYVRPAAETAEADAQWLELWKRIQTIIKAPGSPWTDELVLKAAGVDQMARVFLGPAGAFVESERGGLGLKQESRDLLTQFLDNIDQFTPGLPSPVTVFARFRDRNGRRLYHAGLAMTDQLCKLPPLSGPGIILSQPGPYEALSADAKALMDELFVDLATKADPPLHLTTADVQFAIISPLGMWN